MEQYLNIYEIILTIGLAIFILLFFLGITIKLFNIFIAVMAYPTYVALYSFEFLLYNKSKDLNERKFLKLNIPKGTPKGFKMNVIAMFITSLVIVILMIFAQSIIILQLIVIPYQVSTTIFVCLFLIYLISYFVENENKTAYDKINSLTIPSLWKKIIE
ncbi:MAG: hypothetical protein HRT40_13470 [Campylobacteraceae bacterium]|nr:hypothetical protein [Campylobacteraceae bacterium]